MSALETGSVTAAPVLRAVEFFAGIGLARLGLERGGFTVLWSNDIAPAKQQMYAGHFGDSHGQHVYFLGDVAEVDASRIPSDVSLAWASFPCTDLSLAGSRKGLGRSASGGRSETFWSFTKVLEELRRLHNQPHVIALENVTGLVTSHGGDDLAAAVGELNRLGYSVDILQIDARRFVPQSRVRLFIVGALKPPLAQGTPNSELRPPSLQVVFGNPELKTHQANLPALPRALTSGLSTSNYIEPIPLGHSLWWDKLRTNAFLNSLSDLQMKRVQALRASEHITYRTAYRRMRAGFPVWEVRPDDISGCLRTARGGSSRQAVVRLGKGEARVRWMTPLEYARLQGAGDYNLRSIRTNQGLFGFGDGVCVPVVEWLARYYLYPLALDQVQNDLQAIDTSTEMLLAASSNNG